MQKEVQVHKYTSTQVHKYTSTQVQKEYSVAFLLLLFCCFFLFCDFLVPTNTKRGTCTQYYHRMFLRQWKNEILRAEGRCIPARRVFNTVRRALMNGTLQRPEDLLTPTRELLVKVFLSGGQDTTPRSARELVQDWGPSHVLLWNGTFDTEGKLYDRNTTRLYSKKSVKNRTSSGSSKENVLTRTNNNKEYVQIYTIRLQSEDLNTVYILTPEDIVNMNVYNKDTEYDKTGKYTLRYKDNNYNEPPAAFATAQVEKVVQLLKMSVVKGHRDAAQNIVTEEELKELIRDLRPEHCSGYYCSGYWWQVYTAFLDAVYTPEPIEYTPLPPPPRLQRMPPRTAEQTLGVREGSPREVIRKAYFEKARQWHPDKCTQKGCPDKTHKDLLKCPDEYCNEKIKKINAAYAKLSNPE